MESSPCRGFWMLHLCSSLAKNFCYVNYCIPCTQEDPCKYDIPRFRQRKQKTPNVFRQKICGNKKLIAHQFSKEIYIPEPCFVNIFEDDSDGEWDLWLSILLWLYFITTSGGCSCNRWLLALFGPSTSCVILRFSCFSSRSGHWLNFFCFFLYKIIDLPGGQINDPSSRKHYSIPFLPTRPLVSVSDPWRAF